MGIWGERDGRGVGDGRAGRDIRSRPSADDAASAGGAAAAAGSAPVGLIVELEQLAFRRAHFGAGSQWADRPSFFDISACDDVDAEQDFFPITPRRRPPMPAEFTPEKFQSKDDSSDSFEVDACKLPGHTAPLGGLTSSDREGSIDARSVEHVPVPSAPDRSFFGDSSIDAHSVEHVPAEIRRAQQRAYYAALVTQPLPIAQDCAASQSGRSRAGASEAQVCAELEGRDDEEAESQSSDIADPEPQSLEGSDDEEAESQSSDFGLVDRSDDAEAEPQRLDLVKRILQAKDRIKQMKYPRPLRDQMNLLLLYEWLQNGAVSRQRIVYLLESFEALIDEVQLCQHSDDAAGWIDDARPPA